MDAPSLAGSRIVVGVAGGIAAYKSAHLVRSLTRRGADVEVIPTEASLRFVGKATWEALSHHPVATDVFTRVDEVAHVRTGQRADLLVIAPATADLIARLRMGRADDLLTATALMATCPVVIAPAMHTEMWRSPATVENVAVLRERGMTVLEPDDGPLTGPDSGPGRLPEPDSIADAAESALRAPRDERGGARQDLRGQRVVITLGGTQEAIDPVRVIANHSSGRQGLALAYAALVRGAAVEIIAGIVDPRLPMPPGVRVEKVTSAAEMAQRVRDVAPGADILIMAAAVADYTPRDPHASKAKKGDQAMSLTLVPTTDILREQVLTREESPALTARKIVGFAAETGDADASALAHAAAKARRKKADLIVMNDVSHGVFGADATRIHLLDRDGRELSSAEGTKIAVSHRIFDAIIAPPTTDGDQTP